MPSKAVGPISLRERQKAQTREHLLDVAAGLFADKGYNETTIEDIARAAGSSRATVYSYFSTKEDILRTLAIEMWENTEDTYRAFAALPEWSETAIRGLARARRRRVGQDDRAHPGRGRVAEAASSTTTTCVTTAAS